MPGSSKADVNQSVVVFAGRRSRIKHDVLVRGREEDKDAAATAGLICADMTMYIHKRLTATERQESASETQEQMMYKRLCRW